MTTEKNNISWCYDDDKVNKQSKRIRVKCLPNGELTAGRKGNPIPIIFSSYLGSENPCGVFFASRCCKGKNLLVQLWDEYKEVYMFILRKFIYSTRELSRLQCITVCAMMLALRVILGMFANSLLPFLQYVKIGLTFIPIAIVAVLYGPVCAGIVSGAGDILSIILLNPTAFSINPGITLCCVLEGLLYGVVLYQTELKLYKVIIAKALVLACTVPLFSLFMYPVFKLPYLLLLWYRLIVLVPYGAVEVVVIYYIWKLLLRLKANKHIIV